MTNTPPAFSKALDAALVDLAYKASSSGDDMHVMKIHEAKQAVIAAHEADVLAAQIDELESLKERHSEGHITKQEVVAVHDNIPKGSTLAMVPLVHINDRLEELDALQSQGEEERLSKEDELNETEDILHEGVSEGLYEVAEDNPGSTRYKLTNYGSVEAERIIAEKGLPFLVMVSSRKAIDDGKNRTVKSMADEIIRNFPNKLKREAKKNFALFWGEFASWSPEKYLEAYEQAQE